MSVVELQQTEESWKSTTKKKLLEMVQQGHVQDAQHNLVDIIAQTYAQHVKRLLIQIQRVSCLG